MAAVFFLVDVDNIHFGPQVKERELGEPLCLVEMHLRASEVFFDIVKVNLKFSTARPKRGVKEFAVVEKVMAFRFWLEKNLRLSCNPEDSMGMTSVVVASLRLQRPHQLHLVVL